MRILIINVGRFYLNLRDLYAIIISISKNVGLGGSEVQVVVEQG